MELNWIGQSSQIIHNQTRATADAWSRTWMFSTLQLFEQLEQKKRKDLVAIADTYISPIRLYWVKMGKKQAHQCGRNPR